MKIQLLALFSLATVCFGQDQEVISKANQLRAKDVPVAASSLNPIPTSVIQVIPVANGQAPAIVNFWTQLNDGTFITEGTDFYGHNLPIGTWGLVQSTSSLTWFQLQNGNLWTVLPGFQGFQQFDVFWEENGIVSHTSASLTNPLPAFFIVSAGVLNGKLAVTVNGNLSQNTIVMAGMTSFGQFTQAEAGGGIAVFSADDTSIMSPGLTTLTVCDGGNCNTQTFILQL